MLRITGGRVYDPANGVDGVVKDVCIADGRIVRSRGRRAHDRCDRPDRVPRRRGHPHPRRGRGAELCARPHAGKHAPGSSLRAHEGPAGRARRRHAHHVRHRLSVRRHGLDDRERGRGSDPLREAHARRTARHAHRGQVVPRADGQQRDRAGPSGGGRDRARHARRRLAHLGRQSLRRQGGQPRGSRRVEMGQGRQGAVRGRSKATAA